MISVSALGLPWAAEKKSTPAAAPAPTFEAAVKPLLGKTCAPCHNRQAASGGLDVEVFSCPSTLIDHRDPHRTAGRTR
ncbi:MAG: hypothetical protein LC126_07445 [Bryobacterales bacterium]|nr:hypothetical protein [Bryobacterales bacterium]